MTRALTAIACAVGTMVTAMGAPVVFDNYAPDETPPHVFDWTFRNEATPGAFPGQWLDITAAPEAQTGQAALTRILYSYSYPQFSSTPASERIVNYAGPNGNQTPLAFVARGPDTMVSNAAGTTTVTVVPARQFQPGETVGADSTFIDAPTTYYRWLTRSISAPLLPQRAFIGVRVQLVSGVHYGWVELLRTNMSAGEQWRPLRWAYESTPNTPIEVPEFTDLEPGTFPCPADLDGDGVVSASDLAIVLGAWSQGENPAAALAPPINVTDAADLAFVLGAWGVCK